MSNTISPQNTQKDLDNQAKKEVAQGYMTPVQHIQYNYCPHCGRPYGYIPHYPQFWG